MQKSTQKEKLRKAKSLCVSPWLAFTVTIWLMITLLGGVFIWEKIKTMEQETLHFELFQLISNLEASLDRFKPIPRLIASTLTDVSAIERLNPAGVNQLNYHLEQLNQSLGAEKIFVLNKEGLVIATSNAWKADSVLGEDLSFRPFYQDARRGIDGSFHAVGTTNGRLGQYFSRSLFKDDEFLGVLVLKVNLAYAKNIVDRPGRHFAISDENGIVFLAEEKSWLFRLVPGVHIDDLHSVIGNQQYGGAEFSSELFISDNDVAFDDVVCISHNDQCDYFLHSYAVIKQNDWSVHLFRPLSILISKTILYCVILGLSYWLVVFFWLLYSSKIQHRKLLVGENKRLESRVMDLTADLTEKNAYLKDSVAKLQQSNRELEETQRDLIFADRLALLGEVSVGLHHELNQPILAIKAYAENGVNFLEKNQVAEVEENLHEINDIADSMTAIIAHFKVFSKREHSTEEFDIDAI